MISKQTLLMIKPLSTVDLEQYFSKLCMIPVIDKDMSVVNSFIMPCPATVIMPPALKMILYYPNMTSFRHLKRFALCSELYITVPIYTQTYLHMTRTCTYTTRPS